MNTAMVRHKLRDKKQLVNFEITDQATYVIIKQVIEMGETKMVKPNGEHLQMLTKHYD
jgi:hypothetical protein